MKKRCGWQGGLYSHVSRIVYSKERWKDSHHIRTVIGYLRSLADKLEIKADELDGVPAEVQTPTISCTKAALRTILEEHPEAVKSKLIKELGIGKTKFYKWVREIKQEDKLLEEI